MHKRGWLKPNTGFDLENLKNIYNLVFNFTFLITYTMPQPPPPFLIPNEKKKMIGEKKNLTPLPRIESRSPTWHADILTTTLQQLGYWSQGGGEGGGGENGEPFISGRSQHKTCLPQLKVQNNVLPAMDTGSDIWETWLEIF